MSKKEVVKQEIINLLDQYDYTGLIYIRSLLKKASSAINGISNLLNKYN